MILGIADKSALTVFEETLLCHMFVNAQTQNACITCNGNIGACVVVMRVFASLAHSSVMI